MSGFDFLDRIGQGQERETEAIIKEEIATFDSSENTDLDIFQQEPEEDPSVLADMATAIPGGIGDAIEGGVSAVGDAKTGIVNLFGGEDEGIGFGGSKLVFNIPGLKNHDPNRPFISTMSDREFDELYGEGKINYLPTLDDPDTAAGQFTRDMANVFTGIYAGGTLLRMGKGFAIGAGASIPGKLNTVAKWTGPGAVGSLMSFQPHEERMSDAVVELVEDTPFEIAQPFFEWLGADEDADIMEERFKIALESMLMDAGVMGFSKVFKLWKARRNVMKKGLNKESVEEIEKEASAGLKDISSNAQTKQVLPPSVRNEQLELPLEGVTPTAKVLETRVIDSPGVFEQMARNMANGQYKYGFPDAGKVFNTKYIMDLGPRKAMNIIAGKLKKEFERAQPSDTPSGPKPLSEIKLKGTAMADSIDARRITDDLNRTADDLGVEQHVLFKNMAKDLDNLAELESRIFAYRSVLSQMSEDLSVAVTTAINRGGSAEEMAKVYNQWLDLEDMLRVFGEVRRTTARATTAQRIPIPKRAQPESGLTKEQTKALKDNLRSVGMTDSSFNRFADVLDLAQSPLHRVKILQEASETFYTKGVQGLVELYRGLLLANVKTHVTNTLSGVIETLVTPATRLVGSGFGLRDPETAKEVYGFYAGVLHSLADAGRFALKATLDERNILDPLGTKIDGLATPHGHRIAMDKVLKNESYFHPANYGTLAVNTVGKVARGSLRLLGGEDEFFKQLNYRAKVYSRLSMNAPTGAQARKDYIAKEFDKYFDEMGRATDKELLDYTRRVTFTEEMRVGSFANWIHTGLQRRPELQLIVPFFRTPTNILSRFIERTPGVNFLNHRTREMWMSGDEGLRSQVIGNMALGTSLYALALNNIMDGTITGGGPSDPDLNKIWRQAGNQPYSVKMGGNWVSYNRLDPMFLPFVFLSTIHENAWKYNNNRDDLETMVYYGIMSFAHAYTDRTYLQGLKQVFTMLQGTKHSDPRMALRPVQQLALNMIPAVISQSAPIARGMGLYKGAEGFREALTFSERVEARLVPLSGYEAVKHNWLTGEPVVSPLGYNTGIPVKEDEYNPYMDELIKMGRSIDPPSTYIGNVELNGQQYAELNRRIGTMEIGGRRLMDSIREFMDTPEFDMYSDRTYDPDYDDFRVAGVKKIIRAYKNLARKSLIRDDAYIQSEYLKDKQNQANVMMGGEQLFELNER